jgi:hypothetical protein
LLDSLILPSPRLSLQKRAASASGSVAASLIVGVGGSIFRFEEMGRPWTS